MARPLREYHFSCGNSNTGQIGFCAAVRAHTKKEAAEILADALPQEVKLYWDREESPGVQYITAYINPANVTAFHCDDWYDLEPEVTE